MRVFVQVRRHRTADSGFPSHRTALPSSAPGNDARNAAPLSTQLARSPLGHSISRISILPQVRPPLLSPSPIFTQPIQMVRDPEKRKIFETRYRTESRLLKEPTSEMGELKLAGEGFHEIKSSGRSQKEQEQPYYQGNINVGQGIIAVLRAYRNAENDQAAPHFSETLFQQWDYLVEKEGRKPPPIRLVFFHHVREDKARAAIPGLLTPNKQGNRAEELSSGDPRFKTIMTLPFSKVVQYLIKDHGEEIGATGIMRVDILVREHPKGFADAYDMVYHLQ